MALRLQFDSALRIHLVVVFYLLKTSEQVHPYFFGLKRVQGLRALLFDIVRKLEHVGFLGASEVAKSLVRGHGVVVLVFRVSLRLRTGRSRLETAVVKSLVCRLYSLFFADAFWVVKPGGAGSVLLLGGRWRLVSGFGWFDVVLRRFGHGVKDELGHVVLDHVL